MRAYGFNPEQLGRFNGTFVQDDLEYRAVSSSVDAALQFVDSDREEFREFLSNAVIAEELSVEKLRQDVAKSLAFQKAWATVMPKIEGAWR